MIKLTCNKCKEEVQVSPYFDNCRIKTETWSMYAMATAKAVCPCCGAYITQEFKHLLNARDIAELAQREGTI